MGQHDGHEMSPDEMSLKNIPLRCKEVRRYEILCLNREEPLKFQASWDHSGLEKDLVKKQDFGILCAYYRS